MTTLTIEYLTLGDTFELTFEKETIAFPLFQTKKEDAEDFEMRIYACANKWTPLAKEEDIPEEGPVRSVWGSYLDIQKMSDDDLYEALYDTQNDDARKSHSHPEGMYCRTWLSLLEAEVKRREETPSNV